MTKLSSALADIKKEGGTMKHLIFALFIVFTGCADLAPVETITDDQTEQIEILKQRIADLESEMSEELDFCDYEINRLNDLNLNLYKKIQLLERSQ
jgi:hypothetical protein